MRKRSAQGGFFDGGEDLPLFSGTPEAREDAPFVPGKARERRSCADCGAALVGDQAGYVRCPDCALWGVS